MNKWNKFLTLKTFTSSTSSPSSTYARHTHIFKKKNKFIKTCIRNGKW